MNIEEERDDKIDSTKGEKLVLVKPLYGMGGRLAVFITALEYSRRVGRRLVVDWNGGSFGSKKVQFDVFRYFFKAPKTLFITDEKIEQLGRECTIFPEIWKDRLGTKKQSLPRAARYSRPTETEQKEDIFVVTRDSPRIYKKENEKQTRDLFRELELSDHIQEKVDWFRNKYFSSREVIGVHFRHGNGEDGVKPPDIQWYFNLIDKITDEKDVNIFLCTDCSAVVDLFHERYEGVFSTPKEYLEIGEGAFHYQENFEDKLHSGIEALLDMWLLSHCDYLFVSDSYFVVPVKYRTEINPDNIFWNEHNRVPSVPADALKIGENERLKELFEKYAIHHSGILFRQDGDTLSLFYLDEFLISIPKNEIEKNKNWDGKQWTESAEMDAVMVELKNLISELRYF